LQHHVKLAAQRAAASETRANDGRDGIGAPEGRADMNAMLIAELQAEGMVAREQTSNVALRH
jgi:hypothetical protein